MLEYRAAALPLLLLIFVVLYADASSNQNRLTIPSCVSQQTSKIVRLPFVLTRGGSISDSDDDEVDLDEEGEEDDEEEVEDEVAELDPVMVKAAKKASHKSKEKLTAAVKAKVSAKLAAPAQKTKKSGGLFKSIPYIIRASLNPFTLIAMTKAYFESLFNLNYLQEVRFCCVEIFLFAPSVNKITDNSKIVLSTVFLLYYRISRKDYDQHWKKRQSMLAQADCARGSDK